MSQGDVSGLHTQMQATVAKALGLTVDQLQVELQAGKTVPQIAQEHGVDLSKVRDAVMAQLQASGMPDMAGMAGRGTGAMMGRGGTGSPNTQP
jgi:hypothetical protein